MIHNPTRSLSIFPVTGLRWMILAIMTFLGSTPRALGQESTTADSADLSVQIKEKIYTTKKRFEIRAQGGGILNNPYVEPYLMQGSATYYISSTLGFGLDISYAFMNRDKNERLCIETFYNTHNHPNIQLPPCTGSYNPEKTKHDLAPYAPGGAQPVASNPPNVGPAYSPVREINLIAAGSMVWLPFYGKILLFMSQVVHFHTMLILGGGVTMSDFYPEKLNASNGHPLRGATPAPGTDIKEPGVSPEEVNEYGEVGRPKPIAETSPTFILGIGQKFHITPHIALVFEGRSINLFGTSEGFENYFFVSGGLAFGF